MRGISIVFNADTAFASRSVPSCAPTSDCGEPGVTREPASGCDGPAVTLKSSVSPLGPFSLIVARCDKVWEGLGAFGGPIFCNLGRLYPGLGSSQTSVRQGLGVVSAAETAEDSVVSAGLRAFRPSRWGCGTRHPREQATLTHLVPRANAHDGPRADHPGYELFTCSRANRAVDGLPVSHPHRRPSCSATPLSARASRPRRGGGGGAAARP
jgi:hypothetical protein